MSDVITKPSAGSGQGVEGYVGTRDREDQASAVATSPSVGVQASYLFDPTRGHESRAAYLCDPTRGHEGEAAYLCDPTRARGEIAASLDLTRWGRTKGLSAASA